MNNVLPIPPTPPTAPAPHGPHHWPLKPESFWAIVLRRTRYVIGITFSIALFATIGWKFAAPPPEWGGVTLLVWPTGMLAPLLLVLLVMLATAVCSFLVHPESPHMGLFCALLGLTGLSVRGGTVHMLIVFGQDSGHVVTILQLLAVECVLWGFIVLIGESFARMLHDRFFKNIHWITRSAPILSMPPHEGLPGTALGVSAQVSGTLGTGALNRRLGVSLAMIVSGLVGFGLLYMLMQSQAQGQVIMACFVAFFVSTIAAYLLVPRVPMLPLLLMVPATAAVGYLICAHLTAANPDAILPGHAALFAARTLPITYIAAGVPGAILGYYTAFRWSLHSAEEMA